MKTEKNLKQKYNNLLKRYNNLLQQNAVLTKFKTPTQEKIDAIEEYYLWCERYNFDANSVQVYLKYKQEILKRSQNE